MQFCDLMIGEIFKCDNYPKNNQKVSDSEAETADGMVKIAQDCEVRVRDFKTSFPNYTTWGM